MDAEPTEATVVRPSCWEDGLLDEVEGWVDDLIASTDSNSN